MKLSALIAPLIAAKAPHDQIMAVVMAYEEQQQDALERRRQADADRQSRKREHYTLGRNAQRFAAWRKQQQGAIETRRMLDLAK